MATLLKTGWRNLWRNRRRTLITMLAVALNSAALIISYALIKGMMQGAVQNVTDVVAGEAQIHAPGYLTDRSIYKELPLADSALTIAENLGVGAGARMYGFGLLAHGSKSAGAMFWGVDPRSEKNAFALHTHLADGKFLSEQPEWGITLGGKLARSLNVGVGDEVVVVVQAADGSLGNELFTVQGIYKTVGDEIDRGSAIIHSADFRELFSYTGGPHEISLNSRGRISEEKLAGTFAEITPQWEVKTWRQLEPALSSMLKIFDSTMWLFGFIFFLAAGLGVVNTMLMATFERIREFGVRKALGEPPLRILLSVTVEALVLVVLATSAGAIIGSGASLWLEHHGINTASIAGAYTVSGIAFDPMWRASLTAYGVLAPSIALSVVCGVAALYPASIAARIKPVEAMTHQ